MTPYQINSAVNSYLASNWTQTSIRRINKDDAPSLPFIEAHFKPGGVVGIEIMGATVRSGVFMINVFTKKGVGTDEGLVYGGLLETLFHHKIITNSYGKIICENDFVMPNTEQIGIDAARQAFHHQTIIPFSVITE